MVPILAHLKKTPNCILRGKHPLYFGAKWDDFWWVERFWAILCKDVYREPRPKTIKKVMRRVRETSLNVSEKTLIKLVHQSPARMHEIFKQKGGRIPARWNYKKSPSVIFLKFDPPLFLEI